jgi:hypothetical protein
MSMTSKDCIPITQSFSAFKTPFSGAALVSSTANVLKKKASSDLVQPSPCKRKKTKRVHFEYVAPVTLSTAQPDVTIAPSPITLELNLCLEKSICHYLKQNYQTCDGSLARNCVGYLETPQLYKHMFFARQKIPKEPEHATFYSIFDIMRQEADDALVVEDQLRLAHKTALAILQYNDTPWLSERWRLGQMSYFGSHKTFDETALRTLHLSSQISTPNQPSTAAMDGVESTTGVSDEIRYGINNLPLFFLGVALLEIAHWQPLEEKMISRDCSDQVYAARRLASGRAPLGPEYQKIAQKCLQCNFGFGTKLNSKGLQAAVYNDVVCELEGMMERLTV